MSAWTEETRKRLERHAEWLNDEHPSGLDANGPNQGALDITAALAEIERLRERLMIPGEQRCVECGFELHKLTMRASDGAVGVQTDALLEECPNGHGFLVGVTFERGWREMVQSASAASARAEVLNDKLEAAQKEIERLRAMLEAERAGVKRYSDKWRTSEARIAKLVEALEAWHLSESLPDCTACVVLDANLPDDLFRRAAAKASE